MRHVQACSTFEVRSDSNARMGSSRILRHVTRGRYFRYMKITSEKPYCKYNTSLRHQAVVHIVMFFSFEILWKCRAPTSIILLYLGTSHCFKTWLSFYLRFVHPAIFGQRAQKTIRASWDLWEERRSEI